MEEFSFPLSLIFILQNTYWFAIPAVKINCIPLTITQCF